MIIVSRKTKNQVFSPQAERISRNLVAKAWPLMACLNEIERAGLEPASYCRDFNRVFGPEIAKTLM